MKIQSKWVVALIVSLWLVPGEPAQAQRQRSYQTANATYQQSADGSYEASDGYEADDFYESDSDSLASYNSFENSGSCDLGGGCSSGNCGGSCSGGCSGGGGGILGQPGQFFISADYLYVRSTFSESTAFVTTTGGTPAVGSNLLFPPIVNTFNEFDYDYESSYRISGGYRLCECGGEIRFAFTQFNSGATADSGAVPTATGGQSTFIIGGSSGDLLAILPGDRVLGNSSVDANIYDLGFAKTIPLGSPACGGCDSCDSCCDSGCGWCPAWDIKWSAGIRFAEVNWDRRAVFQSGNAGSAARDGDFSATTMDFEGGGARVGLEGTRYIGRQQRLALFAKSDLSLLLGEVSIEHVGDSAATTGLDRVTRFNSTQLIPVLDIEAGGTFFVTNNITVSAGYLLSVWHDLGMRDTFDVLEGRGPTFDDANILGFDGFFARAEFTY